MNFNVVTDGHTGFSWAEARFKAFNKVIENRVFLRAAREECAFNLL